MRRAYPTVEAQTTEYLRILREEPEWGEATQEEYDREEEIGGRDTGTAMLLYVHLPRSLTRDTSKPVRRFIRSALKGA